jgi:hypothetical protein
MDPNKTTLFDRLIDIGWGNGLMIPGTAALFLIWLILAFTRRTFYPIIAWAAGFLAIITYLKYDWRHVYLNLSMRSPDDVRAACVELLQRRPSVVENADRELHLAGAELPKSFARIGAVFSRVTREDVQICFYADPNGGAWGFLYDQKNHFAERGWPGAVRPTWYRDFYEFQV